MNTSSCRRAPLCLFVCFAFSCCTATLPGQNSPRTEAVFPIFAEQTLFANPEGTLTSGYRTTFHVINPSPVNTTVTFRVFDSIGREVLPSDGITRTATLEANGIRTAGTSVRALPTTVGWTKVRSTQPVIVQEEIELAETISLPIGSPPQTTIRARIAKGPSTASRQHWMTVSSYSSTGIQINTGIAVVYSPSTQSPSPARGVFVLRSPRGEKLAEIGVNLSADTQLVRFFTELFGSLALNDFVGSLQMVFDQPVFATAIQMSTIGSKESMTEPTSGNTDAIQ